ncbi:MAG: hypothetical protein GXP49_07715 [Deltaproteobacteria bacterium]|nr:hypothetical protein [Deltaproteobacteria bacterium]
MKLAAIGAASKDFGLKIISDVMTSALAGSKGLDLVLCDIDEPGLEKTAGLANRLKEHCNASVNVVSEPVLDKALEEADYIILSVCRKRYELWEQDFRLPNALGFKQVLGENAGPGSIFHALRSLNLVVPIGERIREKAPGALVLNFTNPESVVVRALFEICGLNVVGLCHGAMAAREKVVEVLGLPDSRLDMESGGINHFYWVKKIRDRETGRDLYPEFRKRIEKEPMLMPPLARKLLEIFGLLTYPSDDHCGEFLAFGHEYSGLKWPYGMEHKKILPGPAAPASIEKNQVEEYLSGRADIADLARPSGELALEIIADIELDRGTWRPAVIVKNKDLVVRNLPKDAAVEVPAVVDKQGVHPLDFGPLPPGLAAISFLHADIQGLLVKAYRHRSRKYALQALLLNPQVNNLKSAEILLDEMLELQAEFLPALD